MLESENDLDHDGNDAESVLFFYTRKVLRCNFYIQEKFFKNLFYFYIQEKFFAV